MLFYYTQFAQDLRGGTAPLSIAATDAAAGSRLQRCASGQSGPPGHVDTGPGVRTQRGPAGRERWRSVGLPQVNPGTRTDVCAVYVRIAPNAPKVPRIAQACA
jgi:hypothetical protein